MAQTDLHGISPSKEEIESIMKDAFGESVAVAGFERMTKGMMNWVGHVKINKKPFDVILKLSNQPGKWGIAKEHYVMELLRKKAIPVPESYAHDFSKKKYPYEYTIVSKLDGDCLEDMWDSLSKEEQEEIALEMGKTLAKINSIEFKQFARIVGNGLLENYDSYCEGILDDDLNTIYKQHIEAGFIPAETASAIKEFILSKRSRLHELNKPCLVHNDFHFWHIFVKKTDNKWQITGVVDFGFAEIAPLEGDFVKPDRFVFVKGDNIKSKFIEGYRQILPYTEKNEEIVKILRVYYDFWFIYRLFKANNPELATQYVRIIEKAIGQGNK